MEQLAMEVDWAERAIVNRLNLLQARKEAREEGGTTTTVKTK